VAVALRPAREGVGGLICLGRKRSGDVDTTTDLTLLKRVADAASERLAL
jgi:hypothetical protein